MRTYYIEIEEQNYTIALIKVDADSYEEAELKALKALHATNSISEVSKEDVKARLDSGDVAYMLDEDGCEIDFAPDDQGDETDMSESIKIKNTLGKAEWDKLPYYQRAWKLSLIMQCMNNEDAYYSGWLYIWPDGETYEQCMRDFGDKESYEELERSFIAYYSDEEYHNDGLCTFGGEVPEEVVKDAHMWDEALGLSPIAVL